METLDLSYLEIYGYCDPAAGKENRSKRRTARQAIVVCSRDWYDRWFVMQAWSGRLTSSELRDKILDTYEKFHPRLFGIEANGMQVLFGSLVRDAAKSRFGTAKFIPIYQPTNVEKNFRIRTGIEPLINQGRLFLQPSQTDLYAEMRGFPTAQTKDIIDAVETCIRMAPKRPINKRDDIEFEQYARYLRSSNLPASLIERKLADFRKERASTGKKEETV